MRVFFFLLMIIWLLGVAAFAQTSAPHLKSATFYLSVDDWADIWINDVPVIESQPRTGSEKGPQKRAAVLETLCQFKDDNILAVEVDDSTRPPDPANDYVGIAYALQLNFSDGTQQILSSNEVDQHLAYYLPNHEVGNPTGWQRLHYDDSFWKTAQNTGSSIPGLSPLDNPELTGVFQFLSAFSSVSRVRHQGEKHLFRRKFHLDLSPNPRCGASPRSPRIEPMVVNQPDQRHSFAPPAPRPALIIPPPSPTFTPTWTSFLVKIYQTPVAKIKSHHMLWFAPTPTATFIFTPRLQTETREQAAIPTAMKFILTTPTVTFAVIPSRDQGQTIVFDTSPANIYINFGDGPGIYRLEVFDKAGYFMKNLFEMKIVAQKDAWAEWDGKNDGGQEAPSGEYYVIYSKNRKELKRLNILKAITKP